MIVGLSRQVEALGDTLLVAKRISGRVKADMRWALSRSRSRTGSTKSGGRVATSWRSAAVSTTGGRHDCSRDPGNPNKLETVQYDGVIIVGDVFEINQRKRRLANSRNGLKSPTLDSLKIQDETMVSIQDQMLVEVEGGTSSKNVAVRRWDVGRRGKEFR